MTAQATLHAAASAPHPHPHPQTQTQPRRSGPARWAAVLALLAALLGAGVSLTASPPEVCPVIALVH